MALFNTSLFKWILLQRAEVETGVLISTPFPRRLLSILQNRFIRYLKTCPSQRQTKHVVKDNIQCHKHEVTLSSV